MIVKNGTKLLSTLLMLATASSFAQMKLKVELEEIDNKTDEVLVLNIGKKNFHVGPGAEFDANMKIKMVAQEQLEMNGVTPRTLPHYKNTEESITIKQMNPVTKQMSELYRLSVEAFVINIDGKKNLQVSVTLRPKETNRALIEWTEIFALEHSLELDIKLAFEKVNGIIVHKGDTLDIEVEKED